MTKHTTVSHRFRSRPALTGVVFVALTAACSQRAVDEEPRSEEQTSEPGDAGSQTTSSVTSTREPSPSETSSDAGTIVIPVDDGGTSVDSGTDTSNASIDGGAEDASAGPLVPGAPLVNSTPGTLEVDVFGTFQNRYWFIATPAQVDAINEEFQGRGGGWGGGWFGGYGDIYSPNSGKANKNTVDHLLVTTPEGNTADFGEMQVKLVGQSTGRPWTADTLPNIKIDTDDVTQGLRLGGYEHLRFNNGIVGTIYREKFVYELYRALGYPAPLATYGWVSSTVWAPDVAVPYIVVESYKRGFCRNREDYFGGECPNMWEFAQDFGYGVFDVPDNCQFETCDSSRADDFEQVVMEAQAGRATLEDVGEYLDWDRFHEFQCLSWMFGTTDDAIHGGNNTVWVERPDGKFQLLPYSIDISFDVWGGGAQLPGYTTLPSLCQNDEACWADTIATCERLLGAFSEADPVGRLDTLHSRIEEAGMLRSGDKQRYQELRKTLERLLTQLPDELERYRDDPWGGSGYCPYPLVMCGRSCELPQSCYLCQDDYWEGGGTGDGETTAPVDSYAPPVTSEMVALDIAVPPRPGPGVPMPVPPPPVTTAPGPQVDGGVPGGGQKPDFCYWEQGWYRLD